MCFKSTYQTDPSRQGFSLIEIMVVLIIIALLASVVTLNVRGYLITAKQNTAKAEIATICGALETYYILHDRYPDNDEGLAVLTGTEEKKVEPLLSKMPTDPWRNDYIYIQPGRDDAPYEVISLGADGREGGEKANTDVNSADLENEPDN
jgi:general secretion pathway protein G